MTFELKSSGFDHLSSIPSKYTADGKDLSPPLSWIDPPKNTMSFVLIVDDPDAPDPKAPKRTWTHWVVYNIPRDVRELVEGASSRKLPTGAKEGHNDWKRTRYGGPSPPIGRHRYFHKLYALDTVFQNLEAPTKAELEGKMRSHILGRAELIGTYEA